MRTRRLGVHAAVSLIAAAPAGGFLFGILHAGDPDPNPVGRLFYACLMAVATPLHAGFPPHGTAGPSRTINVWPYIAFAGVLICSGLVLHEWVKSRPKKAA
jgi:hypothetical protein